MCLITLVKNIKTYYYVTTKENYDDLDNSEEIDN